MSPARAASLAVPPDPGSPPPAAAPGSMRSPSSVLLGLLKARDASPPDFLCPCDAVSPAPDQPAAPRRPARRPQRPRASTSAPRAPDAPRPPSKTAALDADGGWTVQRRQYNPDMFPRQYVRGDDGFYTLAATYSYHGQKVTCTSGVNSRPNNIDLSSDNGGDTYAPGGGAPDSVVTSVDKNGSIDFDTLPHGWRPVDPKPYSDKLVIGASAAVAGILAILMFGFILWRKPLKARAGRSDNKDKLQKLWEDHSAASLETGIPGRDEDPAMSRVVRAQKRAFSRALARWKTKAKGKAGGLKLRAVQRHMASSNSTFVVSRPHSRAQTPVDWSPSASPVHTPAPTRPASPAPSESAPTIAADDTRDPPRAPTPPAMRRTRDRSRSASSSPPPPPTPPAPAHQILPDREDATSVRDAADTNAHDADSPLSPPAYRRSYGTQARSGYGPATGNLSSTPGIATDEPAHMGDRKQALPPASPPPPSPALRPHSPAPAVDNDGAGEPESMSLDPPLASDDTERDQVRRFAHVATDDKTILASMAQLASQPHEPLPVDPTAPAWDEADDIAGLVLREESAIAGPSAPPSAPPPDLLPQPPSRVAQRSLLEFASAPPPADDDDPAASAPSAPPSAFEDDEFGPEGAMSASAVHLPRYER